MSAKVIELLKKVALVEKLVRECEKLAEETNYSFSLNIAYGMGGTYSQNWNDSTGEYDGEWEWMASSHSC